MENENLAIDQWREKANDSFNDALAYALDGDIINYGQSIEAAHVAATMVHAEAMAQIADQLRRRIITIENI